MNGGGGQQGTELGNWSEGLRGPWAGLINRAITDSEQPYSSFFNDMGQSRVVGENQDQREGMQYTRELARGSTDPFGAMNGARGEIEATLGGQYLGANPAGQGPQSQYNPWTDSFRNNYLGANQYNGQVNPYADQQTQVGQNPFLQSAFYNPYADRANDFTGLGANSNPYNGRPIDTGGQFQAQQLGGGGMFSAQQTDPGTNAFQGMDNPYFQQQMNTGLGKISDHYKNAIDPELRAQMVLNGTLGGGAESQLRQKNQMALGENLSNFATGMLNQQYDRSAGLDESRLGRYFQGQQFDTGVGQSSFENAANRGLQAGQFNQNLGMQSFENAAQRGMQGQQFTQNLGSQNYENALSRAFQGQEAQYGRGYGSLESDIARRFGGMESDIGRRLQASQFDSGMGANAYEAMLNRSSGNVENQLNRGFQSDESLLTRGNQQWQQALDRANQSWLAERGNMMGAIGAGQNEQNLAYQRAQGMMGIGDFTRGIDQQRRDETYQNWFDENNYNRNADAWLAGILSAAQGGLPPSQVGGGASPWANAIGTGLAAYGMFRG